MSKADKPPSDAAGSSAERPVSETAERAIGRRVLSAALVLLVLSSVALVAVSELGHARDVQWRVSPGWLALAVAGFGALHLSHAELWRRILRRLAAPVDGKTARSIWFISTLARYVPTSVLVLLMRVSMLRGEGIARRTSLSAVIHELALAFVGALVLSSYFVVSLPSLADEPLRFVVLAIPLLTLVALSHRFFQPLASLALRRIGRDGRAAAVTVDTGHALGLLVGYIMSFLLGGLSLFALARGLQPVALEDLPVIVTSFAVGYCAAVVAPILPGGVGAREAGLTAAMATVMTGTTALGVAIASRIVQLVIELVFAGFAARHRAIKT